MPLTIGSISLDQTTLVVMGLVLLVMLGTMFGIRRDVALGALVAGGLVIALAM